MHCKLFQNNYLCEKASEIDCLDHFFANRMLTLYGSGNKAWHMGGGIRPFNTAGFLLFNVHYVQDRTGRDIWLREGYTATSGITNRMVLFRGNIPKMLMLIIELLMILGKICQTSEKKFYAWYCCRSNVFGWFGS